MSGNESPGDKILSSWRRLSALPMGKALFSRSIKSMVPYSGNLGARIDVLEPGHCRLTIPDRRANRNHLRSVHALALANSGELCSGLAMLTGMPAHLRGIVTKIETEYVKKARGTITVEAQPTLPSEPNDAFVVRAELKDSRGDVVARFAATWKISA